MNLEESYVFYSLVTSIFNFFKDSRADFIIAVNILRSSLLSFIQNQIFPHHQINSFMSL